MLKSKLFNLILAIVAAIVIWVFVTVNVDPQTTRTIKDIPVELLNVAAIGESGLVIPNEAAYKVDVTVKGPRSDIINLDKDDVKASADVLGFSSGLNSATVNVEVPPTIEETVVNPPDLEIKLSEMKKMTKKIKVAWVGAPDNFNPKVRNIIPKVVEFSGSKNVTSKVEYFRAEIDYSKVNNRSNSVEADIFPVDKNGNHIYGIEYIQKKAEVIFG
jgi:YbbR domain-containing protein